MTNALIVLSIAALMTASAAGWMLRAYRAAGGGLVSVVPALLVCGGIAFIALTAYLVVGRPELPDAPYATRIEALRHRDPTTYSPEETLAVLDQAAKAHPDDARPHLFSGQVLLALGRDDQAERQFDAALRRDPRSADAMIGLGRAMVRIANGQVTPEALSLFQRAGAISNEPTPWIYQTLAAVQNRHSEDAQHACAEAVARGAPAEMCRELINGANAGNETR